MSSRFQERNYCLEKFHVKYHFGLFFECVPSDLAYSVDSFHSQNLTCLSHDTTTDTKDF